MNTLGYFSIIKNWETNEKRWPLYLNYIYMVDKDWSSNKQKSLEHFHDILRRQKIKQFIEKYGVSTFTKIKTKYPDICEYSEKDILESDLRFIKRENKADY